MLYQQTCLPNPWFPVPSKLLVTPAAFPRVPRDLSLRSNDSFVTNRPRLLASSHRDLRGTAACCSLSAIAIIEASKRNGPLTLSHHQTYCSFFFLPSHRYPNIRLLSSEDPILHRRLNPFLTSPSPSLLTAQLLQQPTLVVVPHILRALFHSPLCMFASRASSRSSSPHLPLRYSIRFACSYHSQDKNGKSVPTSPPKITV